MNNLSPPVILVIDSNALSLTATSAVLNCQNYEVYCAQNLESAIEVCQRVSLDLIICDVAIKTENDGYDLIDSIKQVPDVTDVPVVYVTAGQTSDVVNRSVNNGSAYHLKKPYEPKSLLALIEKALWLPHLVSTHMNKAPINKPHISMSPNSFDKTLNTSKIN